ncbi:MAG: hypothetical protein K2Q09_00525 [Phycisphaerales bacterium]|nr:hypothetical protein [Phycisphaerales bacterium]
MNPRFSSTIALALAALLPMTACSSNGTRDAENGGMSASAKVGRCPVCGMAGDARYQVTDGGKGTNCCSAACESKFNNSTGADRQRMLSRSGTAGQSGGSNAYAEGVAPVENDACPIDGKQVSGKFVYDDDGHAVGFCGRACEDQYRAYGPEHRAELRTGLR